MDRLTNSNAKTPAEIACSIISQIIEEKNFNDFKSYPQKVTNKCILAHSIKLNNFSLKGKGLNEEDIYILIKNKIENIYVAIKGKETIQKPLC